MNKIQGLCHVLHARDYFKYQPIIDNQTSSSLKFHDMDKDVYVCESRYNIKTKGVKKIKWWNVPENKRVTLVPRETALEPVREQLPLLHNDLSHRPSTNDNELPTTESVEKARETIPYDSVINDKLNENSQERKQFYEQIALSTTCSYKIGDFVDFQETSSINESPKTRPILRIDQMWQDKR
jgi:hypothetical protein